MLGSGGVRYLLCKFHIVSFRSASAYDLGLLLPFYYYIILVGLVHFDLVWSYKKNGGSTGIRQVSFPFAGYPLSR